ncbi:hypothetical protein BEWA_000550 [Theileria equi strain WA]|uniref:Uncharacterized protein n=1 Tax=Theileria equi strain WA TaxID=1537102 RepID=L0AYK6_THEEQ|nr:hypothetical protein BEWA_000550 [Theileria equi strain WA]AFZ80650.1 hypothetical protein BEWA_000550 [Theileria equi strain WA]|eukprot:XP_004830316.1 hypothetical protein BEWA_000550 [Theileria equi strain WA]
MENVLTLNNALALLHLSKKHGASQAGLRGDVGERIDPGKDGLGSAATPRVAIPHACAKHAKSETKILLQGTPVAQMIEYAIDSYGAGRSVQGTKDATPTLITTHSIP